MPRSAIAVALSAVVKRYPRVLANDGVDLSIPSGTIHALVGENGAGKSTLMKILYGMVRPDSGTIELDGQIVHFQGPQDAIAAGIGMVHQHFMLVGPMAVYENVALGSEPQSANWRGALGAWDQPRALEEVRKLSEEYGIAVDPQAPVETLSVGEQQRVEILKVLYRGARILILDEPTAVLTPQEAEALFATLRRLRAGGATIIFISHKLQEVLSLCDAATVLRRGKTVGTRLMRDTTQGELATMMIGELRPPEEASAYRYTGTPGESLRLEGVCAYGPRGILALREVSLSIGAGEILGVAGVEGNGQRELAQVVCGLLDTSSGSVSVLGRIGHIPEDRHKDGLLLDAPAWESMLLGRHREAIFLKPPWALRRAPVAEYGRRLIADYDVRPAQMEQKARAFSGGNQQKIVVGRELSKEPRLLVAAHPTRGVDLGAAQRIHAAILQAKARGAAILLISADLDEILALSDRVAVLHAGKIMGIVPRTEATVERLAPWMAGVP